MYMRVAFRSRGVNENGWERLPVTVAVPIGLKNFLDVNPPGDVTDEFPNVSTLARTAARSEALGHLICRGSSR